MGEKVSAIAGYGGGGTAFLFGLSSSQWQVVGVVGGLVIGAIGLLANVYFGWKRLQLDMEARK